MTLEAGKLYKKVGTSFVEVSTPEYTAPALTDALELNPSVPNTIAATYIANLETNSLSVSNNTGTGPKVEILKDGAIGLKVNDGTNDVLRAYVANSGDFGAGDVVIGKLTGPADTANKGMMWDASTNSFYMRGSLYGYLDNMELTPPPAGTPTIILWETVNNYIQNSSGIAGGAYGDSISYDIVFPFTGSVLLQWSIDIASANPRLDYTLTDLNIPSVLSSGSITTAAGVVRTYTITDITPFKRYRLSLELVATSGVPISAIVSCNAKTTTDYGAIGRICIPTGELYGGPVSR